MPEDTLPELTKPEDITEDHVDAVVAHLMTDGKSSLSAINAIFGVDRRKTKIARALLKHVSMKHPDLVDPDTLVKDKQRVPTPLPDPVEKTRTGGTRTRKIDRTDPLSFLRDALAPFAVELRQPNGSTRRLNVESISGNVLTLAPEPVEIAVLPGGQRVNITALAKINQDKADEFREKSVRIEKE